MDDRSCSESWLDSSTAEKLYGQRVRREAMNPKHYSILIKWDPRENIYVVTIPELYRCRTHGETHNEAIKNALEVIELWIEDAQKAGDPIPQPSFAA